MTQKDLHNHNLINEANETQLRYHTRRHFLKECAMGFGGLALGSLLQACGSSASRLQYCLSTRPILGAETAYVSGKSQECNLPAHGRRTLAT
jgi:hypothetical protein